MSNQAFSKIWIIIIVITILVGGIFALELGTLLLWRLEVNIVCPAIITPAVGPFGIICIEFSTGCIPFSWRKIDRCP